MSPSLINVPSSLPPRPNIRRILLIRWGALGDVVVCTAILEDLRRAFPDCEIDFNTTPPWDCVFDADPRITRVLSIDIRGKNAGWQATRHWLRTVQRNHYDLVIDLQSNDRSRLLLTLLQLSGRGIPYRMGTRKSWPYNIVPPKRTAVVSALDYYRAPFGPAGIPITTGRGVIHVSAAIRARALELQRANDLCIGRYAILMPGSGARGWLKRWGAAQYAALARAMLARGMDKIALIGSRDDAEECRAVAEMAGSDVVNLCNQTAILEVAALCEDARCVVANDTGTAHIAAASGCPTLVICGPTDPRRVKPPGDNVVAMQAELPCINCYRKICTHHSCMIRIGPEAVLSAIERLNWRGERILK